MMAAADPAQFESERLDQSAKLGKSDIPEVARRQSLPEPALARACHTANPAAIAGNRGSSEVARVSGKVDAVRVPKEIYFASRVMQSPRPDIHIVGHWTYPKGTKKTVYVFASHCDSVELTLEGKSIGKNNHPADGYVYAFPDITWSAGTLKATGYRDGNPVCTHELTTVGEAKAIKLTPIVGPGGLKADGQDVALFDVEVVDAQGRRCPTDESRIDFTVTGPALWRGGYNSGIVDSTNNLFLNTECGINRVAIRSTLTPGAIALTATRKSLTPATAELSSATVALEKDSPG